MAESGGKSRRLYVLIKYWWPSKDTSNGIILDGPLSKIRLQPCIKLSSCLPNSRWVFLLHNYPASGGNTIKNVNLKC
jgi:hypothetical protein